MDAASHWFRYTLWSHNHVNVTPITILRFVIFIILTFWIAHILLNTIRSIGDKRLASQRSMIYHLARLAYYATLVTGFLFAGSALGFDFSQLTLLMSAVGVGVGFGLQNIFNNFFSGIILPMEDKLKLGNVVELEGGVKGEIQAFNFRTITLQAPDGIKTLVPNSLFISGRVTLLSTAQEKYRCLHIPFATQVHLTDVVQQALISAANELSLTYKENDEKHPIVYLVALKENKLFYELWVWTRYEESIAAATSNYLAVIAKILSTHAVELV